MGEMTRREMLVATVGSLCASPLAKLFNTEDDKEKGVKITPGDYSMGWSTPMTPEEISEALEWIEARAADIYS
jgi:hypothetical protein